MSEDTSVTGLCRSGKHEGCDGTNGCEGPCECPCHAEYVEPELEGTGWTRAYAKGVAEAAASDRKIRLWQEHGKFFLESRSSIGTGFQIKGDSWQDIVTEYIRELTVRRLESRGALPEGFVSIEGPPAG